VLDSRPRWLTEARTIRGVSAWRAATEFLLDPVLASERYTKRFGPAVRFLVPGTRRLETKSFLLLGPSFNREVLTAHEILRPSGGLGIVGGPPGSVQAALRFNYLASHGAEHAALARTALPHLSRQRVSGHFEAMRQIVCRGIAEWPIGQPVDLYALVRDLDLRTMLTLLFGDSDVERMRGFGRMLVDYHRTNWRLGARLRVDLPGLAYRRVLRMADQLRDFVTEWVGERVDCPADTDLRAAFLAHRRPNGEPLGPERLTAHIHLMAFAAFETGASAVTWILYLLALHPDVLANLADELAAAPPIESIEQERLAGLPLLDAVIKESLRLVAPVPFLPLRPIQRRDPRKLLPGTIVLSPHLTHRVPELYPEPLRYRPERWFGINPNPFEYLPFSSGARRCPGYHFATEFMRLVTAAFVPRLRIDGGSRIRLDRMFRVITLPKPGITVRLVRQDRAFVPLEVSGTIRDLVLLDGARG
jgi:cytochrome P450